MQTASELISQWRKDMILIKKSKLIHYIWSSGGPISSFGAGWSFQFQQLDFYNLIAHSSLKLQNFFCLPELEWLKDCFHCNLRNEDRSIRLENRLILGLGICKMGRPWHFFLCGLCRRLAFPQTIGNINSILILIAIVFIFCWAKVYLNNPNLIWSEATAKKQFEIEKKKSISSSKDTGPNLSQLFGLQNPPIEESVVIQKRRLVDFVTL